MTGIYAIRDTMAEAVVGGLQLFKHDAVAIRSFNDIATDPQTLVHRHMDDHELICVGSLADDGSLTGIDSVPRVVITGRALRVANNALAEAQADNGK